MIFPSPNLKPWWSTGRVEPESSPNNAHASKENVMEAESDQDTLFEDLDDFISLDGSAAIDANEADGTSQNNRSRIFEHLPSWDKINHAGKAIILQKLSAKLGSFQAACKRLVLEPNEVEPFLARHYFQKQQRESWLDSINQGYGANQTPVNSRGLDPTGLILVEQGTITDACAYLEFLALDDISQSIKRMARKTISWPLNINSADFDPLQLGGTPINLPRIASPGLDGSRLPSVPKPSLEKDYSVFVAFSAAASRATRILRVREILLPAGVTIVGPQGPRVLLDGGRYRISYPAKGTNIQGDDVHTFYISTKNTPQHGLQEPVVVAHDPDNPTIRNMSALENSAMNLRSAPFRKRTDRFGPPYKKRIEHIAHLTNSCNSRVLLQFRLIHGYEVVSPTGITMDFDNERQGAAHGGVNARGGGAGGVGGVYTVVLRNSPGAATAAKEGPAPPLPPIHMLPHNVHLQINITEKMAVFRDCKLLSHLTELGIHQVVMLSTGNNYKQHELDLVSQNGRYNIFREVALPIDGQRDAMNVHSPMALPDWRVDGSSSAQEAGRLRLPTSMDVDREGEQAGRKRGGGLRDGPNSRPRGISHDVLHNSAGRAENAIRSAKRKNAEKAVERGGATETVKRRAVGNSLVRTSATTQSTKSQAKNGTQNDDEDASGNDHENTKTLAMTQVLSKATLTPQSVSGIAAPRRSSRLTGDNSINEPTPTSRTNTRLLAGSNTGEPATAPRRSSRLVGECIIEDNDETVDPYDTDSTDATNIYD